MSGDRKELADLLSRAAAFCEDIDSLDHEDRMDLVEDLRVAEAKLRPVTIDGPTVTLRFRPETWINDYATPVDPEEPDTWQVPLDHFLANFATERDFNEDHHLRDSLRHDGNSPDWVRDWSGPFEVELADGQDPWNL